MNKITKFTIAATITSTSAMMAHCKINGVNDKYTVQQDDIKCNKTLKIIESELHYNGLKKKDKVRYLGNKKLQIFSDEKENVYEMNCILHWWGISCGKMTLKRDWLYLPGYFNL